MPDLEDMIMNRCHIPYREARALVLECRQELNMSKYDPCTEELKTKTEALFELRYGRPVPPPPPTPPFVSDNDSITTPGTMCQSYSYDNSDDPAAAEHLYQISGGGDVNSTTPLNVRPSHIRRMMKAPSTVDILKAELKRLEDPTDTECTEEAEPADDNNHNQNKVVRVSTTSTTTIAGSSKQKKKKKKRNSLLARFFRVGRKKSI